YASWYLGTPKVSVAATADALRYSSPQSFGRHVRTVLGLTAGEFRRELSPSIALAHYRDRLIEPHRQTLRVFNPFGSARALLVTKQASDSIAGFSLIGRGGGGTC